MPKVKKPVKRRAKVVKKRRTNETTWRDVLTRIDKFMSRDTKGASQLWNVLSALRGPDIVNNDIKGSTTEVIRTRALPRCAKNNSHLPACFAYTSKPFNNTMAKYATSQHFADHATKAWHALQENQ